MKLFNAFHVGLVLAMTPLALGQSLGGTALGATGEDALQTGEDQTKQNSVLKTWTGQFGDDITSGVITLRIDHIVSVSIHNYLLNGTVPISELTIDTKGNCAIRVMSHIPLSQLATAGKQEIFDTENAAKGEAKSQMWFLGNTADEGAGKLPLVAKQYPLTTHAHNIEYTVSDPTKLERLYNSIVATMKSGTETTYSINN